MDAAGGASSAPISGACSFSARCSAWCCRRCLYVTLLPSGTNIQGLGIAAALASAVGPRDRAPSRAVVVAMLAAWILFKTQLDIIESMVRSITDIVWTGSLRARTLSRGDVRVVYYGALAVVCLWGIFALRLAQPIMLILLAANIAARGVYDCLAASALCEHAPAARRHCVRRCGAASCSSRCRCFYGFFTIAVDSGVAVTCLSRRDASSLCHVAHEVRCRAHETGDVRDTHTAGPCAAHRRGCRRQLIDFAAAYAAHLEHADPGCDAQRLAGDAVSVRHGGVSRRRRSRPARPRTRRSRRQRRLPRRSAPARATRRARCSCSRPCRARASFATS